MKNILFVALLAGASAAQAAPAVALPSTVATVAQTTPGQGPMSKSEQKRLRKARKQNGPEVYKGTVAEQRRIVTDAPGAEKEDSDTPKKERKSKKN